MRALCVSLLVCLCVPWVRAAPDGLVARWTFDEGRGGVVKDTVGGNDGVVHGCRFVPCGTGHALRFGSPDDYVDCGSPAALCPAEAITVSAWVLPEKAPGSGEAGVVGKTYENFLLTYYTDGKCWWYCGSGGRNVNATVTPGCWHHVVGTFADDVLKLYVDGQLQGSCKNDQPRLRHTVPFLMGRTSGPSEYTRGAHFEGLLDDVSVYNRALSAQEVAREYATTHLTGVPSLIAYANHAGRALSARVGLRDLGPLPAGAALEIIAVRAGQSAPLSRARVAPLADGADVAADLKAKTFLAGDYRVTARVVAAGRFVGRAATVTVNWPEPPRWDAKDPDLKVLNSLVTELRSARDLTVAQTRLSFTNPREGWVFIASSCAPGQGRVTISLPELTARPVVIERQADSTGLAECFRRLPKGRHQLLVACSGGARVNSLAVRAVPEIGFCRLDCGPQIAGYAPKDWWGFLEKHILPNVNLAVSRGAPSERERWRKWRAEGKRWIVETPLPGIGQSDGVTEDEVYQAWARSPGAAEPELDGIICDEFSAGDAPIWASWQGALRRLKAAPSFAGKVFYPYCGPLHGAKASAAFARTCFDTGWAAALERYFPEQHTEAEAQAYIDANLTNVVKSWREADPDVVSHLLVVWGMFAGSNETLDIDPEVDYRAFLDLQFNTLANDPTFFGLYGLTSYLSAYSDEDTMRWIGRAYRHYCIEGRTDRMTEAYQLKHVANPDFADGLAGWTVKPAEDGAVSTGAMPGLSWLEGRYPPTPRGNTFALMRRSGRAANTITQTVHGLRPGRTYQVRVISADHRDLLQSVSARKDPGIALDVTGVEVIPGPSFEQPFASCYDHLVGKFTAAQPAWFNLQNVVFRARGTTAELTITDWPAGKPGGPAGQEVLCNFVQLQPYELEK